MAFSLRAAPSLPALAAAALLYAGCASGPVHTPYSAGVAAARLANDRCQDRYGLRPFASDDFEAEFRDGRWVWGGEGSRHVDGFTVKVSFAPDGAGRRVEVHREEAYGNPDGL